MWYVSLSLSCASACLLCQIKSRATMASFLLCFFLLLLIFFLYNLLFFFFIIRDQVFFFLICFFLRLHNRFLILSFCRFLLLLLVRLLFHFFVSITFNLFRFLIFFRTSGGFVKFDKNAGCAWLIPFRTFAQTIAGLIGCSRVVL